MFVLEETMYRLLFLPILFVSGLMTGKIVSDVTYTPVVAENPQFKATQKVKKIEISPVKKSVARIPEIKEIIPVVKYKIKKKPDFKEDIAFDMAVMDYMDNKGETEGRKVSSQ